MPIFRERMVMEKLMQHLRSIGVEVQYKGEEVQHQEEKSGNIGTFLVDIGTFLVDSLKEKFKGVDMSPLRLADIQVRLRQIQSIEVWRYTEAGREGPVYEEKVNYIITFEPGVTVPKAINASIDTKRAFWRKIKSFEWRAFPVLAPRLKADEVLYSKLLGHLNKDLPGDLCVRRLSDDRAIITTSYSARRLPSREALRCVEDIAAHVSDFVTEWNRDRETKIE